MKIISRLMLIIIGLSLINLAKLPYLGAESEYPETIAVLQEIYQGEVQAHRRYITSAQKADSEEYPNIAQLFNSLANSEAVHALNFRKNLSDLGVKAKEPSESEVAVSDTKSNLRDAVNVEMGEIDKEYPAYIERIKKENYSDTIQNITYAWEAEKQHRDIIKKIQAHIGIFFKTIAKKIEEGQSKYFVCQVCGSTMMELPRNACPICKNPASSYKEI